MSTARDALSQVLSLLASEHRRATSFWRLWTYMLRTLPEVDRELQTSEDRRKEAWRKLIVRSRQFQPVDGVDAVYIVNTPYSSYLTVSDEQIVQEANPWAVVSHLSALIHHQLVDDIPTALYLTIFKPIDYSRVPLGLYPEEWAEINPPKAQTPNKLDGTQIVWTRISNKYNWGIEIAESNGVPIYITDLERTLLDALRHPQKSGGIQKVLQAFSESRDRLSLDQIIQYTDRLAIKILRQRVGYILEEMGYSHPRMDKWKGSLLRGGSAKLIAENEYYSTYSKTWNISLNVDFDPHEILNG